MSMFEGLFEIHVHIFICDGCATYRIVDIQVAHRMEHLGRNKNPRKNQVFFQPPAKYPKSWEMSVVFKPILPL